MRKLFTLGAVVAALMLPAVADAQLAGNSITGTLTFGGLPGNFWSNPGPTVIGGGTEFTYLDGFSGIDVNWDDTGFSVDQFLANQPGGANSWIMTFTSIDAGLFTGISKISDTFEDGLSFGLVDNTVTVSWVGGNSLPDAARFDVTSTNVVPEPGSIALMATGLVGLAVIRRRRRA